MNLRDNIKTIEEKLDAHHVILLMLDFDGTLSPIAPTPDEAYLPTEIKKVLKILSKTPHVFVAIVSGRSLSTLKEKVNIPGISYVGNHGLHHELFGKTFEYQLSQPTNDALQYIKQALSTLSKKYPGSLVEDKKQIVTLHYRLVDKNQVARLTEEFNTIMQPYIKENLFTITYGTMIYEIRPITGVHKGTIVQELVEKVAEKTHTTPLPIYIGDDTTDEDAFSALQNGITIKVGFSENTKATYTLLNTEDVLKFLQWLSKKV